MAKATSSNEIVFKVALKGRPGIWRSIAVRGDQTLERLHEEIFRLPDVAGQSYDRRSTLRLYRSSTYSTTVIRGGT